MSKTTRLLTLIPLIAAICLSGYNLWSISDRYVQEAQIKDDLSKYRPATLTAAAASKPPEGFPTKKIEETEEIVNIQIKDLQNDVNNDIVGWMDIPDTRIDYPFVITDDNNYYLRRDLYGKQAAAGSLFMDYRCDKDFNNFNTIIYGHNMKNGSMFGDLKLFADEWFFESNTRGTVALRDKTYTAEFFAYMVIRADDNLIFDTSAERGEFFAHIKKNARHYREPDMDGRVLTLSTCSYEFNDARIVLLANLTILKP